MCMMGLTVSHNCYEWPVQNMGGTGFYASLLLVSVCHPEVVKLYPLQLLSGSYHCLPLAQAGAMLLAGVEAACNPSVN